MRYYILPDIFILLNDIEICDILPCLALADLALLCMFRMIVLALYLTYVLHLVTDFHVTFVMYSPVTLLYFYWTSTFYLGHYRTLLDSI